MHQVIHGADFTFTGTVELTVELGDGVNRPGGVSVEDFARAFVSIGRKVLGPGLVVSAYLCLPSGRPPGPCLPQPG